VAFPAGAHQGDDDVVARRHPRDTGADLLDHTRRLMAEHGRQVAPPRPIAIVEVLQRAKIIGSETFRYTEPITIVGVIFLMLSIASARLTGYVEDWTRRWR
jgi:hypothetical protein